MSELKAEEIQAVSGGNALGVLAAAVLLYSAADIGYEFAKGLVDGASGK